MRRIPPTIASQHPDNASAPYWNRDGGPFISAYQEIDEAITCFRDLGVSEYMWDWEGKHADAAVIDRVLTDFYDYFSEQQLGRDKFLTFRIPNIWEEKGYNLLQAMTVILSGEDFARDLKFDQRPLFEVILPMTERPEQLMRIHTLFEKLAQFKNHDFTKKEPDNNDYLEVIPLVESFDSQLAVGELLSDYTRLHQEHFGRLPEYIRLFYACSDVTLTSGLLAGVMANKLLLSRCYEFAATSGVPVYPFAGPGALRFRGGLNPDTIDRFLEEFPGVRTVTVQSAFRYDYPLADVKAAIARLEAELPLTEPRIIETARQKQLVAIGEAAAAFYQGTVHGVAADMQRYFRSVPKRRDRRQHIGLLAYARSMGEQTLPRAITFTAGFYSIGVPPEFIGLGRTLRQLSADDLAVLRDEYRHLAADLEAAGRYLNRDNLIALATANPAWKEIQEDVAAAEELLELHFAPQTDAEKAHQALSAKLLAATDDAQLPGLITEMAVLRKSLG